MTDASRSNPRSKNRVPSWSSRSILAVTSAGCSSANETRRASRLTAPSNSAWGSSALTTAAPPGTTLRNRRASEATPLDPRVGRAAGDARHVGDDRRVERHLVDPSPLQGRARDLDHAAEAAALDHRGEHRGQALGVGDRTAQRAGRHAVGPAERPDQPHPDAGRLVDRAEEEARHRPAAGPRHADRRELLGRVARQRVAESRQRGPASGTSTWSRPASGQTCSTTTPAAPRSSAWAT